MIKTLFRSYAIGKLPLTESEHVKILAIPLGKFIADWNAFKTKRANKPLQRHQRSSSHCDYEQYPTQHSSEGKARASASQRTSSFASAFRPQRIAYYGFQPPHFVQHSSPILAPPQQHFAYDSPQ